MNEDEILRHKVARMVVADGKVMALVSDDYLQLKALAEARSLLHLVGGAFRPGVSEFSRRLELEQYPPCTPRNSLYQLTIVNWPEVEPMRWLVVSFPIGERGPAEQLAKRLDLRLADGVPTMLGQGAPQSFPMSGPNVWHLENIEGWTLENYEAKMRAQQERLEKLG